MSEGKISKFSHNCREVFMNASLVADAYDHRFIEPIHLLIALAHGYQGIGSRILRNYRIRENELIENIEDCGLEINLGDSRPKFSPRSLDVIQISIRESVSTKSSQISSGHLLVALTKSVDYRVAQVFKDSGINLDTIRNDVNVQLCR